MEDLLFLRLWDIYNPLLTDHQREITDLYFNYDLSLAEIAENKGVSRQSVSDCLKKCRKQLIQYEEKLHFAQILTETTLGTSFLLTEIGRWAEKAEAEYPALRERIGELKEIAEHDYSEEAKKTALEHRDSLNF